MFPKHKDRAMSLAPLPEQLSQQQTLRELSPPLAPGPDSAAHVPTPYQLQQIAFQELVPYPVAVRRRKTHKELGETAYARFTQELVAFDDGAVRLATRAEPKASYFGANISPYAISGGDALFTGPDGMNAELIDAYAQIGYDVEWLHHQGRHARRPTSRAALAETARFLATKSVGKSAHHDHAYLDHLEASCGVNFDTFVMIRDGFSRSAMSGEAFIALAPMYRRTIVHSDLSAKCFALYPGLSNLFELALHQGPEELRGLGRLASHILERELAGERGIVRRYLGTFDPHPLNALHEFAWILPLINGDNGIYSRAIPLETSGVRGFLSKDTMSQYEEHEIIHALHPNLALIVEDGSHVEGALVEKKIARFQKVMEYMRAHDMSIFGMQHADYIPSDQEFIIAH